MSISPAIRGFLSMGVIVAAVHAAAAQQPAAGRPTGTTTFDSTRFGGLHWRSIGPYRGGRVTAVAGVPSQPLTFYMGATGGGLWKTTDAGTSWKNISDGQLRMGSIGAIAVADGDPNVLYVGMGEAPPRGQSSSWGDGVYKSTDAGKTWRYVGLEKTRSIARVVVDPRNDDVAYVAAEGSRWGPTPDRGIYKTSDGGTTWKLMLHPSDSVAAIDLSMDPSNPRVLYAAMWDFQRLPWQIRSGGPGSAIYKSTDAGETWKRLSFGVPTGTVGKIGVAVSPANPDRVYAIVEADSGGLYRSDDAGTTWHRLSTDRLILSRSWYYTNIIADPTDENLVYVMNAPIVRSIDGGRTFQVLPAKHGDNHALWINPKNHDYMINGNDGGAIVTLNGGKTWSTEDNQPTGQIYRVNVDDQYPYWLYGAQQDNTSIAIPSRTHGPLDETAWYPVAGCESAHIAFDPKNPRYLYGGCYQGMIEEFDRETRLTRNIMAWPGLGLAEPPRELKYRFNWSAPITTSPFDRNVLYHGGNVLLKSSDRGQTWTAISPDLTRNEPAHQGFGGAPITNEGAGGEVYNTIYYIVESPREAGTIWVGTDDGLVQLTRDGGKTWSNVTPKGLGPGFVNAIEVSPFDNGTAYMTYDGYKWNDYSPYIFKTTDYGRTWTKLVRGIRDGDQVRVVRADPVRKGLLFAGTETGAYVSFDDGEHWESLQANLPPVPVSDLMVHAGDLVASTEGRAFWILDDITPLEQGAEGIAANDTKLLKPRDAYRTSWGPSGEGAGANPPSGATIYYHLGAGTDSSSVRMAILDGAGAVVREYSSTSKPGGSTGRGAAGGGMRPIPGKPGLHRVVWDLRGTGAKTPAGLNFFGLTEGPRVPPGAYTVRLTANGKTYTQPLTVLEDPRVHLTADQLAEEQTTIREIESRAKEIFDDAHRLDDVRAQVNALVGRASELPKSDSIRTIGKALATRLDSLSQSLVQSKHTNGQDIINFRNGVADQWLYLASAVDNSYMPVTAGVKARLAELETQWQAVKARVDAVLGPDVNAFNALLAGTPAIVVPPAAGARPLP